jgi:hypothetical protein
MSVVRDLLAHPEIRIPETAASSLGMAVTETTADFPRCPLPLAASVIPEDIPLMSGLIRRGILYRVLRRAEGARLRALPRRVSRVTIAWIRANYQQPLILEDLAEVEGKGVSTLHHHFRTLTALSPLQ